MCWLKWNHGKRKVFWALLILALALLSLWLWAPGPSPAQAHAILLRSIPEADAELVQPPATIEMWFSEPLEADFSGARLLNSLGEEVASAAVNPDPADLTHLTLLPGPLEPGIYTVAWQTLSQVDGHEWQGSFPFTVLNPDGSRPASSAALVEDGGGEELPTPGEVISRWLVLLGAILILGAPLFQIIVAPNLKNKTLLESYARDLVLRAIWSAVLMIVLGSGLQIVVQALQLGDLGRLPDLLLGTRTGTLALVRQALAFTALFVILGLSQPWPLRGREWPFLFLTAMCGAIIILLLLFTTPQSDRILVLATVALAGLGMVLVTLAPSDDVEVVERRSWQALLVPAGLLLFSLSLGSHAGAAPGSAWAILGDFIHLLAAAAWVGGLTLLPVLIWQVRRKASAADLHHILPLVRRFSYLASFAVFVLIVTGLFSSLVELPTLSSLWETSYGLVLLAKLFLIVLALEVAFFNNQLVHRRIHQLRQPVGWRRLNRQIGLEAIFSLGVMLSVAILVQTPAPRSFNSTASPFQSDLPFNAIARADDLYIHLQVTPNQAGHNRFWVHLYHPDNSPVGEVQLVRLLFNYRQEQLGQARVDLDPRGQNIFVVEGAYLNQAGIWDLSVYVRRRGMDDALTEVRVEVPPLTAQVAGASPWENPIPLLPAGMLIAGVLAALGAIPFIWHRSLRAVRAWLFPGLILIGGIMILTALVMSVASIPAWQARLNPAGEPIPATSASIAGGRELYQESCTVCHGVDGQGDGPQAAGLEPPPASLWIHVPLHTDRELYGYIRRGFPGTAMPAFEDGLTSEEMWHLVNYLRHEFGQLH